MRLWRRLPKWCLQTIIQACRTWPTGSKVVSWSHCTLDNPPAISVKVDLYVKIPGRVFWCFLSPFEELVWMVAFCFAAILLTLGSAPGTEYLQELKINKTCHLKCSVLFRAGRSPEKCAFTTAVKHMSSGQLFLLGLRVGWFWNADLFKKTHCCLKPFTSFLSPLNWWSFIRNLRIKGYNGLKDCK